ncbi:MAG: exosortase E/protease, VPEID-CTERM system [Rhodosalinus sp.]
MPRDGLTVAAPGGAVPLRLLLLGALFVAELVALVLVFQIAAPLECRQTEAEAACRALRGSVLRAFCLAVALGLYLSSRRAARARFVAMTAARATRLPWALLHAGGLAAAFLPMLLTPPEALNARFADLLPLLAGGALAITVGALGLLAAPRDWAAWLRAEPWGLLALVFAALLLPDLAHWLEPIWYWNTLAQITFVAVSLALLAVSDDVEVWPELAIIGTDGFNVNIAPQCSGVEGFVLMAAFLALYAALFREQVRMGRFWIVVLPLALLASWSFNVLRIAALILIGAHVSPELALNGFHSFAGWLAFTVLAILVLVVVNRVPWLQRDRAAAVMSGPPLAEDETAALILPFVAFMLSSLAVQAFFTTPALGFPLQAAAMLAALLWLRGPLPVLLAGRPEGIAVAAGLLVGLGWVAGAPAAAPPEPALTALAPALAALWVAARLAGTAILVPVVEELFFRGYVLARLDRGGPVWRALAVAVSTASFAALHDRWLAAALAGLVFAAVYLRRGRLVDAVAAHVVANAVVAAAALWQGDWRLI